MATIKDVARIAGVSISTVSRVINNPESVAQEKRDAVNQAMKEVAYRPNTLARALVSNRSDCIGLMVGELGGIFFAQAMQGIDKVVVQEGKHVIITSGYHTDHMEREAIEFLIQRRCDGLILHSKALSDDALREVASRPTPVVFINRLIPGLEDRCIFVNNVNGGHLATEFLIQKGHREIAFICSNLASVPDGLEREQGYFEALRQASIQPRNELVMRAFPDEQGGYEATKRLIHSGQSFSALFAYSDQMAVGAINALDDHHLKVPEDVSVIGFDDVDMAKYLRPSLTTIHYPINAMGARAALRVLSMIDPEQYPDHGGELEFIPSLVERKSVIARSA
ncbi:LacI family DNA-binding transcriptional regulator [Gynuella sp.]|uniref:LacI family DNA-binding transcriptional regulator n=1 Tax=Gynuella sp. TaxID=2969146 RepID=UPI003D0D0E37